MVTLQADLHTYDHGDAVWEAITQWWTSMDKDADTDLFPSGEQIAFAGGCRFPDPIRLNPQHVTCWIVSQGQDAFDSIAHYAEELRQVAETADAEVVITWTELPHH